MFPSLAMHAIYYSGVLNRLYSLCCSNSTHGYQNFTSMQLEHTCIMVKCITITLDMVWLVRPWLAQQVITVGTELIKKHTTTHYTCTVYRNQ